MASNLSQNECPICFETYIYTKPKMLPCIHTLCEKCLSHLLFQSISRTFKCPICREEIRVPENGIKGFKTNIYLLQDEHTPTQTSVSCDVCKKQLQPGANRCTLCEQNICKDCCVVHCDLKMPRDHTNEAFTTPCDHDNKVYLSPRDHNNKVYLTPRDRTNEAFMSPRDHDKVAFVTPRNHTNLAFVTPRDHTNLAFVTTRDHTNLAFVTTRDHTKLAFRTQRDHTKLAFRTPRDHINEVVMTECSFCYTETDTLQRFGCDHGLCEECLSSLDDKHKCPICDKTSTSSPDDNRHAEGDSDFLQTRRAGRTLKNRGRIHEMMVTTMKKSFIQELKDKEISAHTIADDYQLTVDYDGEDGLAFTGDPDIVALALATLEIRVGRCQVPHEGLKTTLGKSVVLWTFYGVHGIVLYHLLYDEIHSLEVRYKVGVKTEHNPDNTVKYVEISGKHRYYKAVDTVILDLVKSCERIISTKCTMHVKEKHKSETVNKFIKSINSDITVYCIFHDKEDPTGRLVEIYGKTFECVTQTVHALDKELGS